MEQEDVALIRRAVLGRQVEEFFASEVGRYVLTRIDREVVGAFAELRTCNPRDGKVVEELQNKVFRAEAVRDWLGEAILDGLHAVNVIEER